MIIPIIIDDTTRDIATFLSLYFLGDYVGKATATMIENKTGVMLLNDTKPIEKDANIFKRFWHWVKDVNIKSSEDLIAEYRDTIYIEESTFSLDKMSINTDFLTEEDSIKNIYLDYSNDNVTIAIPLYRYKNINITSKNIDKIMDKLFDSRDLTMYAYPQISDKVIYAISNIDLKLMNRDEIVKYLLSIYDGTYVETKNDFVFKSDKPSGSYIGNGDSANRKISTGGEGEACIIWSKNTMTILSQTGFMSNICSNIGTAFVKNGLINISSTDKALNADGVTYYYKIL